MNEWDERDEIDESGENLTQQQMGEGEKKPVDVSWDEESFGKTEAKPDEGEEETDPGA